MVDSLIESGLRSRRPTAVQALMHGTNKKYAQDRDTMKDLVNESNLFIVIPSLNSHSDLS